MFVTKNKKVTARGWATIIGCSLLMACIVRLIFFASFRISSAQMADVVLPGDYIGVNKIAYGLKLPCFSGNRITLAYQSFNPAKRNDILLYHQSGDIMIGRCVGLPGDILEIKDFEYHINGYRIPQSPQVLLPYKYLLEDDSLVLSRMSLCQLQEHDSFEEKGKKVRFFDKNEYHTLMKALPDSVTFSLYKKTSDDYRISIPEQKYWMLSDNNKASADSRYFGFIDHENLVGRAEFIWFSKDPALGIREGCRWDRILNKISR